MTGSLFVVATPIGNLEDLTFRALRTLKEVSVIAAEDTRRTSRLLAHYGISKPLVSLHAHNEHREAPRLTERVRGGESVALVSDAGTPAISDPGSSLVRLCRAAGVPVLAVPGPSAVTAALSVTGIDSVPFTFLGFPPSSGQERTRWFEQLSDVRGAVVFFEAPHRIHKTLTSLAVDRPIFVHREISKIHEQVVEWQISANLDGDGLMRKGEFVVVLGPARSSEQSQVDDSTLLDVHNQISGIRMLTEGQALAATAAAFGLRLSKARTAIKKASILVKRQTGMTP